MTRPDRDYDEILSRELHSMLDPIEPAGDGLVRIRQRIAEPWLKRKWSLLRAEFAALGWLIVVRCEPFFGWARSGLAAFADGFLYRLESVLAALGFPARGSSGRRGTASHRWREDTEPQGWLGRAMVWLRPTLAVGAAVIIVVAGIFALIQVQAPQVRTTSNPSSSSAHHPRGHVVKPGAAGTHAGHASASSHPASGKTSGRKQASKQGGGAVAGAAPQPTTCAPTPTPSATPSPSPSPSPTSPSPTPTATVTATPTNSPAPPIATAPAKTSTSSCSSSAA